MGFAATRLRCIREAPRCIPCFAVAPRHQHQQQPAAFFFGSAAALGSMYGQQQSRCPVLGGCGSAAEGPRLSAAAWLTNRREALPWAGPTRGRCAQPGTGAARCCLCRQRERAHNFGSPQHQPLASKPLSNLLMLCFLFPSKTLFLLMQYPSEALSGLRSKYISALTGVFLKRFS